MATTITTEHPRTQTTGKPRRVLRWALLGLGLVIAVVLLAGGWLMMRMNQAIPADLDLSTTQMSQQGVYQVTIIPQADPIPINQLHRWTVRVTTPAGQPVEGASITVDGDMPGHGHGLPTQPRVTRYLGNGDYLVDGMKFQMTGWWYVEFQIAANGQTDTVRFNLILK